MTHNPGGRPEAGAAKIVKKTVGLTQDDWDWLTTWMPGGNVSEQARECIADSRKFHPAGPNAFGHVATRKPRQRLPGAALRAFAAGRGIRDVDAPAVALKEFFEMKRKEET